MAWVNATSNSLRPTHSLATDVWCTRARLNDIQQSAAEKEGEVFPREMLQI